MQWVAGIPRHGLESLVVRPDAIKNRAQFSSEQNVTRSAELRVECSRRQQARRRPPIIHGVPQPCVSGGVCDGCSVR